MVSVSSFPSDNVKTYQCVAKAPAGQDHAHGHAHVRRAEEVANDSREHGHDTTNRESRDKDKENHDSEGARERPNDKHACAKQRQTRAEDIDRPDLVTDEPGSNATDS